MDLPLTTMALSAVLAGPGAGGRRRRLRMYMRRSIILNSATCAREVGCAARDRPALRASGMAPTTASSRADRLRTRACTIVRARSVATGVIGPPMQKGRPRRQSALRRGRWCGLQDWLPGREAERSGAGPAVVLSEHLVEAAWPAGGAAAADLPGVTGTGVNGRPGSGGNLGCSSPSWCPVPEWPCAVLAALLAACKAVRVEFGLRLVRSG